MEAAAEQKVAHGNAHTSSVGEALQIGLLGVVPPTRGLERSIVYS